MTEGEFNRRKVLKKAAGSTAAAGVLSTMSISVAATEETNNDIIQEDPVNIFEGDEKQSLADEYARTSQFGKLLEKAQSEGYSLKWDLDEIYAGRTKAGSFQREVVSYNLAGSNNNKKAAITIGRDLTDSHIFMAQFDIEHQDERGIPEKIVRFEITNSDKGNDAIQDKSSEIEKKILESDPQAKNQLISELEQSVSTQVDLPDDFPAELDISTCNGCYYASMLVCHNLCGAAGGLACGLLGISLIGGYTCATFVGAVCYAARYVDECSDPIAATICKDTGIGICGPNEKPGRPIDIDLPDL
ncbi:halocin C8-like domain-containing protein [Natrinema altunense]|uniref:Halocin C8-like N-terminal domain-containing protein n=1 Tax=Natrinema altunense TaxID=222984 RepID=A0A482Y2L7_9EURY|nr:halocin C8-like domain-containing protein [Natrinema altunense]RZH69110.1 hypothetical protein ELS17_06575 [Natrinema altunense]